MQASGQRQQAKAAAASAGAQQSQVNAQAAERTDARIREARELRAALRASGTEAGVGGTSIVLLGDDMMGQAGRDATLIEKNRRTANQAIVSEARGRIRAGRAELLGGLLRTGLSGYSNYLIGMGR